MIRLDYSPGLMVQFAEKENKKKCVSYLREPKSRWAVGGKSDLDSNSDAFQWLKWFGLRFKIEPKGLRR